MERKWRDGLEKHLLNSRLASFDSLEMCLPSACFLKVIFCNNGRAWI